MDGLRPAFRLAEDIHEPLLFSLAILAAGRLDADLAAESDGLDGLFPIRILDAQLEIQKGRHGKAAPAPRHPL